MFKHKFAITRKRFYFSIIFMNNIYLKILYFYIFFLKIASIFFNNYNIINKIMFESSIGMVQKKNITIESVV